jgi:hypothetical protein
MKEIPYRRRINGYVVTKYQAISPRKEMGGGLEE